VAQVAANSPGAAAGLREGDVILAIDGRSATDLSYDDVFDLLRGAPGTRINFDVLRGAEKRHPVIVLQVPSLSQ
jgi:carboxyl-terminal processing protease